MLYLTLLLGCAIDSRHARKRFIREHEKSRAKSDESHMSLKGNHRRRLFYSEQPPEIKQKKEIFCG